MENEHMMGQEFKSGDEVRREVRMQPPEVKAILLERGEASARARGNQELADRYANLRHRLITVLGGPSPPDA